MALEKILNHLRFAPTGRFFWSARYLVRLLFSYTLPRCGYHFFAYFKCPRGWFCLLGARWFCRAFLGFRRFFLDAYLLRRAFR